MAGSPAPQRTEMNQLRQDAMRRAREMQARAKISSSYAAPPAPDEPAHHGGNQVPPHQPAKKQWPGTEQPAKRMLSGSPLDGLLAHDSERTLILLLILILMADKADSSLILALMYLLI